MSDHDRPSTTSARTNAASATAARPVDRVLVVVAATVFIVSTAADIFFSKPAGDVAIGIIGMWLALVLVVGAVILLRRPGHPVGTWLAVTPPLMAVANLTKSYAVATLVEGSELPFGKAAAWLSTWLTLPAFACLLAAVLVFPTGRLPSRRWRRALPFVVGLLMLAIMRVAVRPGPIDGLPGVVNPLGPEWGRAFGVATGWVESLFIAILLALIASLSIRLRRADHVERQQIKLLVYAVVSLPIVFMLSQLVQTLDASEEEYLGFIVIMLGLMAIPVSIGVAILRYRLFEIDVVVNRAFVYVVLTAILAAIYVLAVTILQTILGPLTEGNDLAVAASTLAVAAAFNPARRRVQGFIDHYFYKRKYDAQRTIDAFSTRLRDDIDIGSLNLHLVQVVGATMQPAHVSVWLRAGEEAP